MCDSPTECNGDGLGIRPAVWKHFLCAMKSHRISRQVIAKE